VATRARSPQERREAAEARRARRASVTTPEAVMEAAAAFLAVRSRSVEETRRRLNHLGYPPTIVDQVVDRLVELDYLDDPGFARAWVESRDRARPRGAMVLRRELRLKGVPNDVISEVLANRAQAAKAVVDPVEGSGDPDRIAARQLIERRSSTLRREADPRRRRQKAYALLARNGFAPDICNEVASSVAGDDPE
jgi:regulatory protein